MHYTTFIHCNPPTTTNQAQRGIFIGKDGRPHVFIKAKGKRVEADLRALLYSHIPPEDFPRNLPVRAEVVFCFPYRKTEKKSIVRERRPIPHCVRPDVANLEKFLLDCMTRLRFWNDDSQVYDLHLRKYFSSVPGIGISIIAGEEIPSVLANISKTETLSQGTLF